MLAASGGLAGGNSQTLAALLAAPLEDQTAILGPHTDHEPVGSATTPVVGLKGNAHNTPHPEPVRGLGKPECYRRGKKTVNVHAPATSSAYARFRTFPHLWKKLWKTGILPDL